MTDIAANSTLFNGKLMVPFLGSRLEDVINKGEMKLAFEDGRFGLKYYDNFYPLKPGSYSSVLKEAETNNAIEQLLAQIDYSH